MRTTLLLALFFVSAATGFAQSSGAISLENATRILTVLTADSLEGRDPLRPSMEKAIRFLEAEMKASGLKPLPGTNSYRQPFELSSTSVQSIYVKVNGSMVLPDSVLMLPPGTGSYSFKGTVGEFLEGGAVEDFSDQPSAIAFAGSKPATKPRMVVINNIPTAFFSRLKKYLSRSTTTSSTPVARGIGFYGINLIPEDRIEIEVVVNKTAHILTNVLGYLPGKGKLKNEQIIFSGHYDHLGIGRPNAAGDSIYNGANDDAAGVTAALLLGRHYARQRHARSVVVACFTAEEMGLIGSTYFGEHYDVKPVVAMVNLEMLGSEGKWGPGTAFLTGYDKGELGPKLAAAAPADSSFRLFPDPYVKEGLFGRSDNLSLARLGVPAHTISSAQMDKEIFYHDADDEIEHLNLPLFTRLVQGIQQMVDPLVQGTLTPARLSDEVVKSLSRN